MNAYTINKGGDRIIRISIKELGDSDTWIGYDMSVVSETIEVYLVEAFGSARRKLNFRLINGEVEAELDSALQDIGTYSIEVSFQRTSVEFGDSIESVCLNVGEITIVGTDDGSGNFRGKAHIDDAKSINYLRRKISSLESSLSSITKECDGLRSEVHILERSNSELTEDKKNLQSQNSDLRSENERAKKDISDLQTQNSGLSAMNTELVDNNNALVRQSEVLSSENTSLKGENVNLSNNLEKAKKKVAETTESLNRANSEVDRLTSELVVSNSEIAKKDEEISAKNAEIEKLKADLEKAINSNESELVAELRHLLKQAESERDIAISERGQLRKDKQQLEERLSQLTNTLKETEKERNNAIKAKEKAESDLAYVIENIKDGKTPQISIGEVREGETNATLTHDGEDEQGNPRLRLNLTLARGMEGKMPKVDIGTVSTVSSEQNASATIRKNGDDGYIIDLSIPRGADGSDATININAVSIIFDEIEDEENISSGETLPILFGKIKKIISRLADRFAQKKHSHHDYASKEHNHDGAYASKEHSHTGYATTDHDHDGAYAKKIHTHDTYAPRTHTHSEYAATGHNHDSAYSKRNHTHSEYAQATHTHSELERLSGANKVTTLTALPTSKRLVIANLSTATNITLSSPLSTGQEMIISINSTGNIKQPIPTSGGWISLDGAELDIKSGKVAEISILCIGSSQYVVSSKAGK